MIYLEVTQRNCEVFVSYVLQTVWLIFVIRQLHSLLLINYLQWFFPEGLDNQLTPHQLLSLVVELVLVPHVIVSLGGLNNSLDTRLISINSEYID